MNSRKSGYLLDALKTAWRVDKRFLLSSITLRIVLGFIPILKIWALMKLVNAIAFAAQHSSGYDEATIYLGLQVAMMVLHSFFTQIMMIVDDFLEKKVDYAMQKDISRKAATVPYAYFDDHQFFNHFDRLIGSLGQLLLSPIKKLFEVCQQGITLCSFLFYLFSIHWILAVLSMLSALPVFFLNAKFGSQIFFYTNGKRQLRG